jgi:hypothetical protein
MNSNYDDPNNYDFEEEDQNDQNYDDDYDDQLEREHMIPIPIPMPIIFTNLGEEKKIQSPSQLQLTPMMTQAFQQVLQMMVQRTQAQAQGQGQSQSPLQLPLLHPNQDQKQEQKYNNDTDNKHNNNNNNNNPIEQILFLNQTNSGCTCNNPNCQARQASNARIHQIDYNREELSNVDNQALMLDYFHSYFPKVPTTKIGMVWVKKMIWKWISTGQVPTAQDILKMIFNDSIPEYYRRLGEEFNRQNFTQADEFYNILKYNIEELGNYDAKWVYFQWKFKQIERRFGSMVELEVVENNMNVINDPNHQEGKKQCRPVDKLDKLPIKDFATTLTTDVIKKLINNDCVICMEEFKSNDKYYELPGCGHLFHANIPACEGLKKWLEENNTCPLCKKEIIIIDDENTKNINTDEQH